MIDEIISSDDYLEYTARYLEANDIIKSKHVCFRVFYF